MYELLNAIFEGVKICVIAYFVAAGVDADVDKGIKGNKKYFFPRWEIRNYNVLIYLKKCIINQNVKIETEKVLWKV